MNEEQLRDLLALPPAERLDLAERLWQSVLGETMPEEQELRLAQLVQALEARARGRAAGRAGAVKTPREFGQDRGLFTVPEDFDEPLSPKDFPGFD